MHKILLYNIIYNHSLNTVVFILTGVVKKPTDVGELTINTF